jgi:hypothetical protein
MRRVNLKVWKNLQVLSTAEYQEVVYRMLMLCLYVGIYVRIYIHYPRSESATLRQPLVGEVIANFY